MASKSKMEVCACFLFIASCCLLAAADPVVSNVRASQRPGTQLVDIIYDLADPDSANLTVSVAVSDNGGSTYAVPVTTFSGALGAGITPGNGKKVTWDAGADWPGKFSSNMRFRVTANDVVLKVNLKDYAQSVNGYQEQFDGTTLNSVWQIINSGTAANVYTLNGKGVLKIATTDGDPNHLLLTGVPYDTNNQEVLARFRIINFGMGDAPRGGIGMVVTAASGSDFSRGIDLLFRDVKETVGGTAYIGKHLSFLDDLRSWGNRFAYTWEQGAWYWLRVAHTNSNGNPMVYGKIWEADGLTPEPTDWMVTWNYTSTPARNGFAGITSGSAGGPAEFECDYFLLKALGLPLVTVSPTASPPEISGLFPENRSSYVATNAVVKFKVKSAVGVSLRGISLSINGVDQTTSLVIGGSASFRAVSFPASFEDNKNYTLVAKAISDDGQDSTLSWTFNTFCQDNFSIEAEDFNFNGGQYVDHPAIGVNSPYFNMVGMPWIDEYREAIYGDHDYRGTNPNTGLFEAVGTRVIPMTEIIRKVYLDSMGNNPLAGEIAVGWINDQEWLNYTRTFTAGTYQVYARIAALADSVLSMDWVTSSTTTSNQTTSPFGLIKAPSIGTTDLFSFAPLVDAFGNPVIQRVTAGVNTLRWTKLSGTCDLNFFQFVPAADPGNLAPFVSYVYPAQYAKGINPMVDVRVTIADRDFKVVPSSVQLSFDMSDVTSIMTKSVVPGGLQVSYSAITILPASSTHMVTLVYADNAQTPNRFTNTWQFTVAETY